ncbi:MAG: hypothetical protein R3C44_18970 [Chloroflexota bacterium]
MILIGIILLTLPCYATGIILLSRAPDPNATPAAPTETVTTTATLQVTEAATQAPPVFLTVTAPVSPTPLLPVRHR